MARVCDKHMKEGMSVLSKVIENLTSTLTGEDMIFALVAVPKNKPENGEAMAMISTNARDDKLVPLLKMVTDQLEEVIEPCTCEAHSKPDLETAH